jgi:hypothetical protein
VIGREEAKKLETNKDTNGKNDEQPWKNNHAYMIHEPTRTDDGSS